tara:strand:- start:346 stop:1242 length:897 start_codon:yes stop_codon:yes gene_type:complete
MKISTLFIALTLCALNSYAQSFKWDIGAQAGIANYFGDLASETGTNSLKLYQENTRYSGGLFARVRASYRLGVNFQLNYVYITGADSLNQESDRTSRNLNFRNQIIEGSTRLEYYPIIFNDVGGHKRYSCDFHLYLFAGLGLAYSNPQAEYNGGWEDLRPLQTEGVSYSAIQPVIPIGLGGFFTFKGRNQRFRRHRIGIEINWRKTFTDYLDDVSSTYINNQDILNDRGETAAALADRRPGSNGNAGGIRGNPDDNDGYGTISVSYSFVLASGKRSFFRPRYNYTYGKSPGTSRKTKF